MTMTRKQITEQITESVTADEKSFSKATGTWTFRRTFFYRHGGTAESFAARVSEQMKAAGVRHTVVDQGEHDAPFRGGQSVKAGSHWWVKVRVYGSTIRTEGDRS